MCSDRCNNIDIVKLTVREERGSHTRQTRADDAEASERLGQAANLGDESASRAEVMEGRREALAAF